VEEAHLLANGTVALVYPNRILTVSRFHVRRELEFQLVSHFATVAGAGVCLENRHGRGAGRF
jgi:hypothetical protein